MANNSSSGGDYDSDYYDYYNLGSGDHDNGYKEAEKYIWIVGGVTLLVVGTFGNLLALAVLTRPKMRRSNAAVYLIVVAVTDLAALYTGLLRQVIFRTTGRDIREESDLSCKLHTTLVYVFLDFSAWLLAALSLERLFSVCRPHTVKHHCTRMTSACVISGIGTASLAINAHFLFRMGDLTVTFGDQARTVKCVTLSEDYYYFVATVWPWVDLTVFALLPLVIHIVCNVFIVKSVVSSFRQARRSRGTGIAADTRYRTPVDTAKSSSSGQILNSVDTTKSARSGQTHTSVDTTKRSASNGQTHTSVDTTKSAPCGLTHTSADSFVGGSSSIGVNCTVCNRECTCEDRSLARLKECSCKSECSSQDGKMASLTSSFSDAECSSKGRNVASLNGGLCDAESSSTDRNVASLNGGLCDAESSSTDRNVASLNGGLCDAESSSTDRNIASLCHAECSRKDRIFSQNSSARTLNHAALTRGCTSLDGDAEDNATDVRTQGSFAKDSETCPMGRVQINGLNAPKDSTSFSERTKQHEGQDEIGSTSEGSEAKLMKNDSRGKTTSAGKDPRRVSTLEPGSAPLSNSNGSDSQAMELTVSQTDPPTANSVHTKCKPKEKSGCVKASVESAVDLQRSSTAASPNPTCARDDSRVSSMTVMLVTVSSVFCVTTVPISLYTIINWILVERGYDYPHREVIWAVVNILMYTNNAVNFILYSLSGSRFRAELKDMWHTLRPPVPRPSHVRQSRASTSHSMTSNCGNTSESYVEGRRWSSLTEMSSTGSQDAGNPSSTSTVRVAEEDV